MCHLLRWLTEPLLTSNFVSTRQQVLYMLDVEEFENKTEYREYTTPDRLVSAVALLVMVVLSFPVFPGWVEWFLSFDSDYIGLLTALSDEIVFIIAITLIHEYIHYAVGRALDYEPDFGIALKNTLWLIKEPAPYVVIIEEFVSRDENMLVLIAPFLLISGTAFALLIVPIPAWVIHYAGAAFVFNTAGSMGDIYNCAQLLSHPQDTEFVNVEDDGIRTFYSRVE